MPPPVLSARPCNGCICSTPRSAADAVFRFVDCDTHETCCPCKCIIVNVFNGVRNVNSRETCAILERPFRNCGNVCRKCRRLKRCAPCETLLGNILHIVRQNNFWKCRTIRKTAIAQIRETGRQFDANEIVVVDKHCLSGNSRKWGFYDDFIQGITISHPRRFHRSSCKIRAISHGISARGVILQICVYVRIVHEILNVCSFV